MIRIDHVTCGYDEDILKDIEFAISRNKITFMIGKNGSGKSTLANILTGLKTDFKGTIDIEALEIKKNIPMKEIRKRIGMVFQNPSNQIIFTRVYDDIKFSLENMNIGQDKIDMLIDEALKTVGMEEYKFSNPYELSGGQKQKIAIASVLAMRPSYIVFDEATSMLDVNGKKEMYEIYKKLKEENIGIICITNILDELIYADEIIILDNKKVYQYTKVELLNNLNILLKHGLEIPFTLKVVEALHKKGIFAYEEEDILKELEAL